MHFSIEKHFFWKHGNFVFFTCDKHNERSREKELEQNFKAFLLIHWEKFLVSSTAQEAIAKKNISVFILKFNHRLNDLKCFYVSSFFIYLNQQIPNSRDKILS